MSAAVVTWFLVAPHLGRVSLWPAILLVSFAIIPGTLVLAFIALPLWRRRWVLPATVVLALAAWLCTWAGWDLPANFAKLWAAIFAGWAFLSLFEELWWVVLVACIIPLVDSLSVWRGPTHELTKPSTIHIYRAVAIAFLVPGGGAAYLGPPDVLFFALFLAAAYRWRLRVGWTWIATTGMYAVTVIMATAAHVGGLPALPFLSVGFLGANADILWRQWRGYRASRSADSPAS